MFRRKATYCTEKSARVIVFPATPEIKTSPCICISKKKGNMNTPIGNANLSPKHTNSTTRKPLFFDNFGLGWVCKACCISEILLDEIRMCAGFNLEWHTRDLMQKLRHSCNS